MELVEGEAQGDGRSGEGDAAGGGEEPRGGVVRDVRGPEAHAELEGEGHGGGRDEGGVLGREEEGEGEGVAERLGELGAAAVGSCGAEGLDAEGESGEGRGEGGAGEREARGLSFEVVRGEGAGVVAEVHETEGVAAHEHEGARGGEGDLVRAAGEAEGSVGDVVHQGEGREEEGHRGACAEERAL
jgi:hypothetical protein